METNPTSIHEDAGLIPGLIQGVKDLALLWLWCRPAAAAPIRALAWELPCTMSVALKSKKRKNIYMELKLKYSTGGKVSGHERQLTDRNLERLKIPQLT